MEELHARSEDTGAGGDSAEGEGHQSQHSAVPRLSAELRHGHLDRRSRDQRQALVLRFIPLPGAESVSARRLRPERQAGGRRQQDGELHREARLAGDQERAALVVQRSALQGRVPPQRHGHQRDDVFRQRGENAEREMARRARSEVHDAARHKDGGRRGVGPAARRRLLRPGAGSEGGRLFTLRFSDQYVHDCVAHLQRQPAVPRSDLQQLQLLCRTPRHPLRLPVHAWRRALERLVHVGDARRLRERAADAGEYLHGADSLELGRTHSGGLGGARQGNRHLHTGSMDADQAAGDQRRHPLRDQPRLGAGVVPRVEHLRRRAVLSESRQRPEFQERGRKTIDRLRRDR